MRLAHDLLRTGLSAPGAVDWYRGNEATAGIEEEILYEKTALEHGSPFTWTQRETLTELEQLAQIHELARVRLRDVIELEEALSNADSRTNLEAKINFG